MKPYIVCHMMSSVDGRSLTDGWHLDYASDLYESTAATFEADGWICGRVTMQEIAHGDGYPKGLAEEPVPRTNHFAKRGADQYAISIDPKGLVEWKSDTALKSHIIEVVTEQVADDYLAYLQSIGVSYVFGGKTDIDLGHVIETLADELGVKKLIVEGGSHVSGAFVNAGLVDEVSVLILPLVDGRTEHPSSFEVSMDAWKQPAYLTLTSVEQTANDGVWLRYTQKTK
ncbi:MULTISPECIES: dihydrofolate reductase family protein [Burkholderiaceae]|jgi:riboflavin biosynthesis pyrimidine reductase|uniref:Putative riboflavin-specific deaminase n=1 Tax=Caballeronia sordidicola TaxID=196367 RepID=A0A242MZ74_CABSO|nr:MULTISPECIES: dihydrofolate reductase family protein [Burkholderiaceae]MDP9154087.1 dihydrofolate reductase family protein [Pseudomonadota bacterium]AME25850.1 pyrimidine reductase [Burkholderia sp. PAMC 26561]AMM17950.1 pyrimidine reductase [Burkholderia sp. PAMC 28687]OTP73829.1 putative riboflavin-specific deaminase [Caballeronia sordidicola]OTP76739.1 putative riboflavin-specific deaminase [Caballeronia sordidicola]